MRTPTFWLLVITFGIASMGVSGLNLHVYPYVTDLGHPPVIAATVMSVIASMQLASPSALGTYGRAHGRSRCGHAQIRHPSYRFRIGHFDDKSFLSLRGILSLWHRFRGQHGFAGDSLGELLWPTLPWHSARSRASLSLRRWRPWGRLFLVFCSILPMAMVCHLRFLAVP